MLLCFQFFNLCLISNSNNFLEEKRDHVLESKIAGGESCTETVFSKRDRKMKSQFLHDFVYCSNFRIVFPADLYYNVFPYNFDLKIR